MRSDRHVILQLLAQGRINAAQAERLLAAFSAERETVWAIACCIAIAAMVELHSALPQVAQLVRAALAAAAPLMHHGLISWGTILGGLL